VQARSLQLSTAAVRPFYCIEELVANPVLDGVSVPRLNLSAKETCDFLHPAHTLLDLQLIHLLQERKTRASPHGLLHWSQWCKKLSHG